MIALNNNALTNDIEVFDQEDKSHFSEAVKRWFLPALIKLRLEMLEFAVLAALSYRRIPYSGCVRN